MKTREEIALEILTDMASVAVRLADELLSKLLPNSDSLSSNTEESAKL